MINMAIVTGTGKGCESCIDDYALAKPVEKLKFVSIRYDQNNNSLDLFLKRKPMQWNNGVGIMLNNLSDRDKEALKLYLEYGK